MVSCVVACGCLFSCLVSLLHFSHLYLFSPSITSRVSFSCMSDAIVWFVSPVMLTVVAYVICPGG